MAKKKTESKKQISNDTSQPDDAQQPHVDEHPHVRTAADALRAAQEELHKAQTRYLEVREQAAQKVEEIRDTTVGDVVDGALEIVRKYPGSSLLAALAVGFMLDRWIRR